MRALRYWMLPAFFFLAFQAAAQDKKEKKKDFDETEWRVLDSADKNDFEEGDLDEALSAQETDSVTVDEIDTAVEPEEAMDSETGESSTVEDRIRSGELFFYQWDSTKLGEWDESGQTRLTLRKISATDIEELRKMDALNYGKDEKPVKAEENKGWLYRLGKWVRENGEALLWTFYILLGALILAALAFFIKKNDISFRWSSGNSNHGSFEAVTVEGPQNFDALASAAIAEGRLRDAVRFRYLHALHLLETRQLITPGKDKTNMDFLRELSRTAFHKPFAALTLHYEYVWYGQLPLNSGQFSQLDNQFAAFTQSIKQHP